MIKTVIGSFDSFDEAQRVVRDLKDQGFMASDISIVASNVRGDHAPNAADGRAIDPDEVTDVGSASTIAREDLTSAEARAADLRETVDESATEATSDTGAGATTGAVAGGVLGGAAGVAVSLMGLAIPGIGPVIAAGPIIAGLTGVGVGAVAGGLIGGLTSLGVPEEHAGYYAESVRRGGALVTVRCDESRAEEAAAIIRDHGAIDIERRVERWRDTGWKKHDPEAHPYGLDQIESERSAYTSPDASLRTSQPRSSSEWARYEDDFRSDYQANYSGSDDRFDDYAPAYRHGIESARIHEGRQWDEVETDIRRDWENKNPGMEWQRFKAAARRGWERLVGDRSHAANRGEDSPAMDERNLR